jgi:cytidylate kinase
VSSAEPRVPSPEPRAGSPESRVPSPGSRRLIIALDGPSGAGKGTIARALAARLGYRHVDTGAMYRALAWKALHDGLALSDEDALADLAVRAAFEVGEGKVRIDGHDVASAIRTPEIDRAATAVARQPRIREALVARQRAMGADGAVVMEGRDIGTVVFPKADVKIFLDASPEERARRRATDPGHASGTGGNAIQDVAIALAERDANDRARAASPLVQAEDAVVIDTTSLSIDESVARALALVNQLRSL